MGAESSGKGTQIELLRQNLAEYGQSAISFHEPLDEDWFTKELSELIYSSFNRVDPLTTAFLYSAARSEIVKKQLIYRKKGFWILTDRNYIDTIIYQHFVQGVAIEACESLNNIVQRGLFADLVFYLDIDVAEMRERAKQREVGNQIDNFNDDFHQTVIDSYRTMAAKQENWITINARKDIVAVSEDIFSRLEKYLPIKEQNNA